VNLNSHCSVLQLSRCRAMCVEGMRCRCHELHTQDGKLATCTCIHPQSKMHIEAACNSTLWHACMRACMHASRLLCKPGLPHKSLTGFLIGFKRLSAEVSSTHGCAFDEHRTTRAFQREHQAYVRRIELAAVRLAPSGPGVLCHLRRCEVCMAGDDTRTLLAEDL
jgi:hypothetical protein